MWGILGWFSATAILALAVCVIYGVPLTQAVVLFSKDLQMLMLVLPWIGLSMALARWMAACFSTNSGLVAMDEFFQAIKMLAAALLLTFTIHSVTNMFRTFP